MQHLLPTNFTFHATYKANSLSMADMTNK